MKLETVLTVAQSKRLIARGIREHPAVKAAFTSGTIGICRGTTTGYVAEEFTGKKLEPFSYTTGLTLPPHPSPPVEKPGSKVHDVIIRRGEVFMEGETVIEAAHNMEAGDVIIKGANALNYSAGIAGCLVGHPAGGTVGGFWGHVYGKKLKLVIPVGLEKEISTDIMELSRLTLDENPGNALMPMNGDIVTEIEALHLLTGAEVYQLAAGGIRGAEGAVRLLVCGSADTIGTVRSVLAAIEQEPPY